MKKIMFVSIIAFVVPCWSFCQDKRFITFYATREGAVGHAFVSFLREDPVKKMTVLEGCWGFYPKNRLSGGASFVIGEVEGQIRDDFATQRDVGLTLEVSTSEYDRALNIKKKWESARYELTVNDCISFVSEVAKSLQNKIELPLRGTFDLPHSYIEELKIINNQSKICPLHPDIVSEYNKERPNYHFYSHKEEICDFKKNSCCTKDFIFEIMKSKVEFTAPYGGSIGVIDCKEFSLPGLGSIVTKIENKSFLITNFTKSNHALHEGKVMRYVVEDQGKIYVYTIGVGNNKNATLSWLNQNALTVNLIWSGVNRRLKEEVDKQLKKKNNGLCGNSSVTLFLFDLSGSMNGNGAGAGISKLAQAKDASKKTLNGLKNSNSGLKNEVGVLGFSGDCHTDPTRMVSDFKTDLALVEQSIDGMTADGGTPLAEAIEAARCKLAHHLDKNGQDKGKLIILSDGQATCGKIRPEGTYNSAPLKVWTDTVKAGKCSTPGAANIRYYTIGFNIEPGSPAERDLQYLSDITGGKYLNAQSQTELETAFRKFNRVYTPKTAPASANLPPASVAKFDEGVGQVNDEAFATAVQSFEDFAKLHANDAHGAYNLAIMQEANELYRKSITNYQKYLRLLPNAPDKAFVESQIAFLEDVFRQFLLFQKEVVKSDLQFLKIHFDKIQSGESVATAEEFKGFLKEKSAYYKKLPDLSGKEDYTFKRKCQDIVYGLENCAKTIKRAPQTWDRDSNSTLSILDTNLQQLLEFL